MLAQVTRDFEVVVPKLWKMHPRRVIVICYNLTAECMVGDQWEERSVQPDPQGGDILDLLETMRHSFPCALG